MSIEFLKGFVKESWYLFVVVAVALVAAFYGFLTQDNNTLKVPVPGTVATSGDLPRGLTYEQAQKVMAARPKPPSPLSPQEKAITVIAEHQETIAAAPDSADVPAYLNAMGNLSINPLRDYEKAAQYFEELLAKYPYWISIRCAYPNLAKCYKEMGRPDLEKEVWQRMMNRYPENSIEYGDAKMELERDSEGRILDTEDGSQELGEQDTASEGQETASGSQ